MFTLCIRDHFMIAHSFRGAVFGPAQRLHGATYVVDVEFRRPSLDPDGVVVDIGAAAGELKRILEEFNYRNLDDEAAFAGVNTTTEVMAKTVFDRMAATLAAGNLGANASGIDAIKVTLRESHVAWAAYEGTV
jgi:6-pyruvoyl-tetrahydropterin synthase